jgi:ABC-type transport system involved in multi-copper enzyme maturation permease subunit
MKGLLLEDYFILKKQIILVVIIYICYAFIGYLTEGYIFIAVLAPLIFAFMTAASFTIEEKAKWSVYALALPVSRSQYAASKYLLHLLLTTTGVILGAAYTGVMLLFSQKPVWDIFIYSPFPIIFCLIYGAIQLAVIFAFGGERGMYIMLLIYILLLLIAFSATHYGLIDLHKWMQNKAFLKECAIGGSVLAVVLFGGSFLLSKRIVEKKEY